MLELRPGLALVSSPCSPEPVEDRWDTLLACLTLSRPTNLPSILRTVKSALQAGGIPFEVMAGSPASRYGARISFRPGRERRPLAEATGLAAHPWGLPDLVGLRQRPDGTVHAKGYHLLTHLNREAWGGGRFVVDRGPAVLPDGGLPVPSGLPDGLDPWMVALDGAAIELYLHLAPARTWTSFATACAAVFDAPAYPCVPHPWPVEQGFSLSLRWEQHRLSALTLYADQRALPHDDDVSRVWCQGMEAADRMAYQMALAGVRGHGPRGIGRWHAILCWTLEHDRTWHRSASLRVPR
jgi:hypothetical protein